MGHSSETPATTTTSSWQRFKSRLFGFSLPSAVKESIGYVTPLTATLGSVVMSANAVMLNGRFSGNELVNHTPNMMAGWVVGTGASLFVNSIADHLQLGKHDSLGTRLEKGRRILTVLGSAAIQLGTETGYIHGGTGDWKDFALGVAATLPGIWLAESTRMRVLTEDVAHETAQALITAPAPDLAA